jgi:hypothetical protein
MQPDNQFTQRVAIIATVAAFLLGLGIGFITPRSSPPTKPPVEQLTPVELATQHYLAEEARRYGDVFYDAATEVRKRDIEHARELLEFLQERTKTARELSYKEFGEQWSKDMPDEELGVDLDVTAAKIQEYGEAWRRVADQLKTEAP